MDVTLKQLRTLIAVADHGGVAAAARAGNIAQPAVTRTLRELERALDTRLFARSPSGMTPTVAGEALLLRARRVMAELAAAEHEISTLRGSAQGRLVIGTLPFMRSSLVPVAVSRFLEDHPEMEIALVDESYEAMLKGVASWSTFSKKPV
jgi:DNA-binding transcriptional LysR family regulator